MTFQLTSDRLGRWSPDRKTADVTAVCGPRAKPACVQSVACFLPNFWPRASLTCKAPAQPCRLQAGDPTGTHKLCPHQVYTWQSKERYVTETIASLVAGHRSGR